MEISERLQHEMKRRNITSKGMDAIAGLPTGTTDRILNGRDLDDPEALQLAMALDLLPSYLVFGTDTPANLWREGDRRRAENLNLIWHKAKEWNLKPKEAHQLFDRVMLGLGRRRTAMVPASAVIEACHDLFGEPASALGTGESPRCVVGNDDPHDPRVEEP